VLCTTVSYITDTETNRIDGSSFQRPHETQVHDKGFALVQKTLDSK